MKKTLVALAVATTALVATSANAATVYEKDGSKVEIGGQFRVAGGKFNDDQRGDLRNVGSRLHIKASHDLGNGLSALAGYELRFDKRGTNEEKSSNTFGDPTTKQLYAGFKYEPVGTLTFGRQFTNFDDFDVADYTYTLGGTKDLNGSNHAKKAIKFRSAEFSGFSFGLDYMFGESSKTTAASSNFSQLKYGYAGSIFYSMGLAFGAELNTALAYGEEHFDDKDATTSKTGSKSQYWRSLAELKFGPTSFAVEYGQKHNKVKDGSQETEKARFLEVGAKYQVLEPSAIYVQWQRNDYRKDSLENKYIVGVDYKFHPKVITYVEYAHSRTKTYVQDASAQKDHGNEYIVGLRVYF